MRKFKSDSMAKQRLDEVLEKAFQERWAGQDSNQRDEVDGCHCMDCGGVYLELEGLAGLKAHWKRDHALKAAIQDLRQK